MFFRILKRDLKRKKSMNIILLIFIILAATFLASSVNNLITISQSINYFHDKAKAPDYIISSYGKDDNKEFNAWLNSSKLIDDYDVDSSTVLSKENIKIEKNSTEMAFEPFGNIFIEAQPKKFGKLLDDKGNEVKLKPGEIAFSIPDKVKNNLKQGDKVRITLGNINKEFTIKLFTKDAIFGSSMNETKRLLISDEDYEVFKAYKEAGIMNNYYIMSKDTAALEKEFKHINCNTIINFDKSFINQSFVLDMLPSAILIIVSLCLIIISFLILRFTIIFTLQDDFKEIGIMKAIGIKDFQIKKLYLIKYFAITIVGALIGFGASFYFSDVLLEESSANILMKASSRNSMVNAVCSIFIVLIVILFCYMCTRRLNKFSAIDAIRNGSTGESFKSKGGFKLRKYGKVTVPFFLALNDITHNIRRFVVLILTFCIGTILIIVPMNAINTLKDGHIIRSFGLEYSDVLIEPDNMDKYIKDMSKAEYINDLNKLEENFSAKGMNMKLYGQVIYRLKFYAGDKDNVLTLMSLQSINKDTPNNNVLKGRMPRLENEIALTESVANKLKVSIGDTVTMQLGNSKKELIVTGLYESMTNMGQSVRLSPAMDMDFKYLALLFPFQGNFQGSTDPQALIDKLKKEYPSYSIKNPQQYVSRFLGSSLEQLGAMKNLIVLIVIAINALITILMVKTFINKEKGEIAMLKSIGFRNGAIRYWQTARISMVLTVGIILAIISSKFFSSITIGQIFGMMGVHNIEYKIDAKEVYLFYPLVLLVITTAIAYFSSGLIKKVDLKEINNME
ncbi:ABC transporter permease [Clostridium sp. 19966]|uniref:ABC transporter permease n=1 Tax=Clostridium sp. 19966 TaxID=2768166 RepID=UPI0028DE553E|nr:FtsX-like permease family protein [Clostridium sp. 19966]MDT8715343.1 ABC transporter permease [Clostridium sp. 19966]